MTKSLVQLVQVDRGYTYQWLHADDPLEVGDRVLLPANWLSEIKHGPGPFPATVLKLGSDYAGPVSTIIKRLPAEPVSS